jgi:hypothetical protein
MATTRDVRTQRVKEITAFIGSQNLSLNEFLITFYSSQDSSISRQHRSCLMWNDGTRFTPEELIDLWLEKCPSGSRSHLERIIVARAGNIIVREADRACKLDSLRVPTTRVDVDDLEDAFVLAKLEAIYCETLPCLWMLLDMVATSWNRSEKWRDEPTASKEKRAKHVEFLPRFCVMTKTD